MFLRVDDLCHAGEGGLTTPRKYNAKIMRDENPLNPRVDYDNLGTMFCLHRRYTLGDKDALDPRQDDGLRPDIFAHLPLYLYDHSGLTMRASPFSCPWDSGQVGIIYVAREKVAEEYPGRDLADPELKELVLQVLECEVETYNSYLQGECFGYSITDTKGNHLDSCWGFLGEGWENAMIEHVQTNYKRTLKTAIEAFKAGG